jgi:hypothetical protein
VACSEEKKEGFLTTVPLTYAFMPLKAFASDDKIKELASQVKLEDAPFISTRALDLQKSWVNDERTPQLE